MQSLADAAHAVASLISTLLVFHLAAHFDVEVSSRDTGRAHTWETCGIACWRRTGRVLFPGPYCDCLSLGLSTSLVPETIRKQGWLLRWLCTHACLPAVVVLGILHVSDRRFLHSSRAHNYTERPLEARFIHGLWSAGIAERHLEGAPKRRGNARHPTTASRLAAVGE